MTDENQKITSEDERTCEQYAVQKVLRKKLAEFQKKNPSFSIRAFAKRLGLQSAATSEILRGERRISRKMAERIVTQLMLDPTERNQLLKLFPDRNRRQKTDERGDLGGKDFLKLTADQFQIISDGIHFALLSLIRTKNFQSNAVWMAKKLKTTPVRVEAALKRLQRLELIEWTTEGQLVRTDARVRTTDDLFDVSIQKAHLQDMENARAAMEEIPVTERDFTALTLPGDPALFSQAKEIIRQAQNQIEALLETQEATEVYRMSVYLYPLTKKEKGE